jgi:hypothetical protein
MSNNEEVIAAVVPGCRAPGGDRDVGVLEHGSQDGGSPSISWTGRQGW